MFKIKMSKAHEFRQLEGALANLDDLIGSMTKDTSTPTSIPSTTDDVDFDAIIADLNRSFPMATEQPAAKVSSHSSSTADDANDYEQLGVVEPYPDYDHLKDDDEVFKEELGDGIGDLQFNKGWQFCLSKQYLP
jgi:hypothetical protein